MKHLKYILLGVAVLVALAGSITVALVVKNRAQAAHAAKKPGRTSEKNPEHGTHAAKDESGHGAGTNKQPVSHASAHAGTHTQPRRPGFKPSGTNLDESLESAATNAPPPMTDEIRNKIRYFKDTTIAIEIRREELKRLARKADDQTLQILTTLGNERIYLNGAAVEALGAFKASPRKAEVEAYLREKLKTTDSQLLCSAIRGYTALAGADAVPELAVVLKDNRTRPDGHHEIIRMAVAKALVETASPEGLKVLDAELQRSGEKDWTLEYGSEIISVLAGHMTDDLRKTLRSYADRLEARKPAEALAAEYFDTKIKEARDAAK